MRLYLAALEAILGAQNPERTFCLFSGRSRHLSRPLALDLALAVADLFVLWGAPGKAFELFGDLGIPLSFVEVKDPELFVKFRKDEDPREKIEPPAPSRIRGKARRGKR